MVKAPLIGWATTPGLTPYPAALAVMEARAAALAADAGEELVWLVEHPPLYTAGLSAKNADLLQPDRFPVYRTERGGQFTYHGPGQRVAYVMLDLRKRGRDLHRFVANLEAWLIAALARFNIEGEVRPGRIGVWVRRGDILAPAREDKIAAIGVRVKRWATYHGVALNVEPDLSHFTGIVPCGLAAHGVTSLVAMGRPVSMGDVDFALRMAFEEVFGPVRSALNPLEDAAVDAEGNLI
ncbi:MAG: lipoyl(octanoyl) transferase LipB [Caulobacterales bacterium]